KPWSQGGHTDLADAVSLCTHHHHRIHDHAYASRTHAQRRHPLPPTHISRRGSIEFGVAVEVRPGALLDLG
ncbi:MAG: hypothetical protein L0H31_08525, partial [Nocardioidaceae bacterium]|nr:hypothetical protein [Nocardioidaceae bacterium]